MHWSYLPISAGISIGIAHLIKEAIYIWKHKKFSWHTLLAETGGMPSSHSAGTAALTTAIGLTEGITTSVFWLAFMLTAVTARDSFGVRRNVGDQANLLNKLLSKLNFEKKVNLVLGHTPLQVGLGLVLGIASALILYPFFVH